MSWAEDEGHDTYDGPEEIDVNVWRTREGKLIDIADMEDSHLVNTIRLLQRSAEKWRSEALTSMYSTAGMLQGEQATYDIDRDIDRLEEATIDELCEDRVPQYKRLLREARIRNVTI